MPSYKKIRDLGVKSDPDKEDELAVSDKNMLFTNRISINDIVKSAFNHSDSILEADSAGNLVLKNDSIDGSKIKAGSIDSIQLAPNSVTSEALSQSAVQEHLISNKTSQVSLADNLGITRTLDKIYYGTICVLVNSRTDGSAYSNDNEAGPNPREFDSSDIVGTEITIVDHGLFNGSTVRMTGVDESSVIPEGSTISDGQNFFVKLVDEDTIEASLTPGGTAVNFAPGFSGSFYLSRETIVARDVGDWTIPSGGASYAPVVNYNFSTFEAAYSWCARNASLERLFVMVGHESNEEALWNDPTNGDPQPDVDPQFMRPQNIRFFGNLNDGGTRLQGWGGAGGAENNVNYYPYGRAKFKVYCKGASGTAIWFRGPSHVETNNIWWQFDFQNTVVAVARLFTFSGAVTEWSGSQLEVINAAAGSYVGVPILSNEWNVVYFMGNSQLYIGLPLTSPVYVVGCDMFSKAQLGAPSGDYYVTMNIGGAITKRKYNARTITSLEQSMQVDNSNGNAVGGGDIRDFNAPGAAF